MADGNFDKRAADRAAAEATPLAELNPGLPDRFAADMLSQAMAESTGA